MDERIKEIAKQINFRELAFAGFKFVYDNKNLSLIVMKGVSKKLIIKLNSLDLYDIRKFRTRGFKVVQDEEIKGVYYDQLQGIIMEFFKFEYVMEGILN